jgi:hypothetical protein
MFQLRSSAFSPSIAVIQDHLRAVEKELEKAGRIAGRRTATAAQSAGDQIGDTVSTILNDMLDRFYRGRRIAGDEAARLGHEAVKTGGRLGNDALQRVATEAEQRPLLMLGIAVGIGILIGTVARR